MLMNSHSVILLLLCYIWGSSSSTESNIDTLPPGKNKCASNTGDGGERRVYESSSLTYLVDTTGSMKDDLQQLKLVNGWLLDQVSAKFPCGVRQYTMVEYNDPNIGPVQTTNSTITFDGFFNNINVRGGGDCPEMVITGLKVALESSPSNSVILVLTDASAKDYDDRNLTSYVDMLIATKQSKIFFLTTGQCSGIMDPKYLIYRDIASASFGHVFRVKLSELNKVFYYLDFILSRPVNSSVRLFSADYNAGDNNDSFSVADNFTSLIVTTDGITHSVQVVRPNGSEIEHIVIVSENWGSAFIVKKPVLGTWTIHVRGEGLHSIRVEGFKAKNTSFTAHCSDCHPNATCDDYFGNKECSCDEGFIGDGFTCSDIDECAFYWSNKCTEICVNTLGSYTCECRSGYTKDVKDICVDINECSDAELNECHSLATCSNSAGSYSCSCKAGHYGDGFQCHPEECRTDTCDQGMECIKQTESFSCSDPCVHYITIDEPWRSTFNTFGSHCDRNKTGWYRFTGRGGIRIPEACVPEKKCSTGAPMWINGSHPSPDEGIITLTACAHWNENCCHWRTTVKVKACPLGYHVYKLNGIPKCPLAFCTDPASLTSCSCADDEECKMVNGAEGCYCKDGQEVLRLEDLDFELTCNPQDIKVSFRTCQLKSLNLNATSVYLSDKRCRGIKDQNNTSVIYVTSSLHDGGCGAQLYNNGTHAIYRNIMYFQMETDKKIIRNSEAQMNFSCVYPLDLILKTTFNPVLSSTSFTIEGAGQFNAYMALYKDQHFISTYEEKELVLPMTATLHVGVNLESTNTSQYVVAMKNCYATPNRHGDDPVKHYIIKERCPNKEDATIRVLENGVSLRGLFSVQVFKFAGDSNMVYLHCEINLCDTKRQTCKPSCSRPQARKARIQEASFVLEFGPIMFYDLLQFSNGISTPTACLLLVPLILSWMTHLIL